MVWIMNRFIKMKLSIFTKSFWSSCKKDHNTIKTGLKKRKRWILSSRLRSPMDFKECQIQTSWNRPIHHLSPFRISLSTVRLASTPNRWYPIRKNPRKVKNRLEIQRSRKKLLNYLWHSKARIQSIYCWRRGIRRWVGTKRRSRILWKSWLRSALRRCLNSRKITLKMDSRCLP